LQAVEPNSEILAVAVEPHFGQATVSSANSERARAPRAGGAMPYSCSLRRPVSVISSVDHGGDSTVSTRAFAMPASASAASTASLMACVAGQPV